MPASSQFFDQRHPQAVLKHGVLVRYATYFAGRAGLATGGRVAFIDGFAGEGRYEDGSPGSPLLLASRAPRAELLGRDIKLAFVEYDDGRRTKLAASLAENDFEPDQLLGARFQDVIDDLLTRYDRRAVLLFVDPFGLAMDRDSLVRILRRSSFRQPLDVLYHFSLSTVARMGRAAVSTARTAEHNASLLDAALGPLDWSQYFEGATDPGEATLAAIDVARAFGKSIRQTTGLRSTAVQVRQRPSQLPKYLLMLFSSNAQAHWDFADQASMAHVDWLYHCASEDYEDFVAKTDETGVQSLWSEPPPDRSDLEEQLTLQAAAYFEAHLTELLTRRNTLKPIDSIEDIYGELLGRARVKHLRSAFKRLHAEGTIDNNGAGDFWTRPVRLVR
jgi:three-Cys-motif partner protein